MTDEREQLELFASRRTEGGELAPLLDPVASREAKLEAIERVDRNADPDWKATALDAVREIALSRETFTPDDVWLLLVERGVEMPHEKRALGPVMLRARKEGYCSATGQVVKSQIKTQHQNLITVWRSGLR